MIKYRYKQNFWAFVTTGDRGAFGAQGIQQNTWSVQETGRWSLWLPITVTDEAIMKVQQLSDRF